MWQDSFVDRPVELGVLHDKWALAKAGTPQLIGITAEQGFGKTRLVQRFFEILSTTDDRADGHGWWPNTLAETSSADSVTPALRADAQGAMPFLWWGLRLRDPGAAGIRYATEISSARDVLRLYLRQALALCAQRDRYRKIAGAGIKLAMDVAIEQASFGFAGTLKAVGEAGKQIYDIHTTVDAGPDHVTDIIADLRTVCAAPDDGASPIPMCLFVDDFQFLSADLEACRLLDELTKTARAESWPLLIVVTSWERGWHGEVNQTRIGGWGLATTLVALDPLGLRPLLQQALPGLSGAQQHLLLDRAEGNPRSLKYLLANLIDNHRYLFEGRDPDQPLTAEGEAYVRDQTHDKVVAERFANSPELVKSLLAAASVQGIGFAPPLAVRMSRILNLPAEQDGFDHAERPYAFITMRGPDAAEFRQNNVWRAASAWLPNLADADAAQAAYREAVTALAKEAETPSGGDDKDEIIARERLADDDPWLRQEGRMALRRMFWRARGRREFAMSAALAKRWLDSIEVGRLDDLRHAFNERVTHIGPMIELLKQGPDRDQVRTLLLRGFFRLSGAYTDSGVNGMITKPYSDEDFNSHRTAFALMAVSASICMHGSGLLHPGMIPRAGATALDIMEPAIAAGTLPITWDPDDGRDHSFPQYNLIVYHDLLHTVHRLTDDADRKAASASELRRIAPLMRQLRPMNDGGKLDLLLRVQTAIRDMQSQLAARDRRSARRTFDAALSTMRDAVIRSPDPMKLAMHSELYALGLNALHGKWFWPQTAKRQAVEGLEFAIRAYQAGTDVGMQADTMLTLSRRGGRALRDNIVVREFAPALRSHIQDFDQWVLAATGTTSPPFIPREVVMNHAVMCLTSSYIQSALGRRAEAVADVDLATDSLARHIDFRRSLRDASIAWRFHSLASLRALQMGYWGRYRAALRTSKQIIERAEIICKQHEIDFDPWAFYQAQVPDIVALD